MENESFLISVTVMKQNLICIINIQFESTIVGFCCCFLVVSITAVHSFSHFALSPAFQFDVNKVSVIRVEHQKLSVLHM